MPEECSARTLNLSRSTGGWAIYDCITAYGQRLGFCCSPASTRVGLPAGCVAARKSASLTCETGKSDSSLVIQLDTLRKVFDSLWIELGSKGSIALNLEFRSNTLQDQSH